MNGADLEIETVRGALAGERAEEVMAFWRSQGALSEATAAKRLREVICLLRAEGAVVGVNSAFAKEVELIGGRRFWVYRSRLAPGVPPEAGDRMIAAAFAALEADFDPGSGDPIGLCVLIGDRAEMLRRPEAEWRDPRILYAGYLADGRQVRIGYFEGAKIHGRTDG